MEFQPAGRRTAGAVRLLSLAVLLTVCCTGTAFAAASSSRAGAAVQAKLAGKWKGQYGGAVSGHFVIHWKQSGTQLTGTPAGGRSPLRVTLSLLSSGVG